MSEQNFVPLPPNIGGRRQPGRGRGGRFHHRGGPPGRWNRFNNRGGPPGRGRPGFGGGGRGRGRGGRGGGGGRGHNGGNEIFAELGDPATAHPTAGETEASTATSTASSTVSIAVEGCCHGSLDAIYDRIRAYEQQSGRMIELLLCCGDFQSLRNPVDYESFACPPKYRQLGSFSQYYSGEKIAPVLTIFVGGNHEASQSLQELYYGGWVAPNIYYMGSAGVVNYRGIRIGGISGIYNDRHYRLGHFEKPPYDSSSVRSVYHTRSLEVYRMKCLMDLQNEMEEVDRCRRRLDVVVSHDWPQGIEAHGNTAYLLRAKPFFRDEVERNCLGSPANRELLYALKPKHWFAAHLHVGFRATVVHDTGTKSPPPEQPRNQSSMDVTDLMPSQVVHSKSTPKKIAEEHIIIGTKADDTTSPCSDNNELANDVKVAQGNHEQATDSSEASPNKEFCQPATSQPLVTTKFVSLDKCLPGRKYLSIAHIPVPSDREVPTDTDNKQLEYDLEWLAILRKTHELTESERRLQHIPNDLSIPSDADVEWVRQRLESRYAGKSDSSPYTIPTNFVVTVPPASDRDACARLPRVLPVMGNPQTDAFLDTLDLGHILTVPYDAEALQYAEPARGAIHDTREENEIDIDDEDDEGERAEDTAVPQVQDENEIDIDDVDTADDSMEESERKKPRMETETK